MTDAWLRLKSGSDIRGIAVAEEGKPATLTEDVGTLAGAAFARWLSQKLGKPMDALTVSVGHDSRVTGDALKAAMLAGLMSQGVQALDCSLCTTPAMFMTTALMGCDGAVMVTASHLPWQRNGYKFFSPEGGLDGADITTILRDAAGMPALVAEGQHAQKVDFLKTYMDFLAKKAQEALGSDAPLAGLRVVVDAGNGAGGFYAALLESLGADTQGSQFLEPDGTFPNHIPNPEDPGAMQALADVVPAAGADLGVIFDADCDRMALVDGEGRAINRNRLIALISAVLLRERPGATIVTDSVSSAGLQDYLSEQGGVLHRFKRGYRNVIDEAKRLNAQGIDCPLAIETSGHAALRENYFLDDGMYLATRLIIEAMRVKRQGQDLMSLLASLREPAISREARLPILSSDFRPFGEAALAHVQQAVASMPGWRVDEKNREGVRVECGEADNWFLLRLSLHDPLMVLNAESNRDDGVDRMLEALRSILSECENLDLDALRAR